MHRSGREFPSASAIPVVGPLGATTLQEALDLIAAAGPFFTTEVINPYVLGAGGGSESTLKTFAINSGTNRFLRAHVDFSGGTTVTPLAMAVDISAVAARGSGGAVTVWSPNVDTTGAFGGFGVKWAVSGTDVVLQFRASGGPTVNATIRYNWLEKLPS